MTDAEQNLLDQVDHAVFCLEPGTDGVPRYSSYNAFALNVLEKPLSDIVGKTAVDLFPGRLGRIAFAHHVRVTKSRELHSYETRLPIQGREMLVHTTLRPVLGDDGELRCIIGSSQDISGDQIFREMRSEMDVITSEMEEVMNVAAHDFQAPLRHVAIVAELLREDFSDLGDGKLELIDILEDVAKKAMGLIGDVLTHSQTPASSTNFATFDFQVMLNDLLGLIDPLETCDVRCVSGRIEGDEVATQIVLRNLIDNAIKHFETLAGPANDRLQIDLELHDVDDCYFKAVVRDNGPGFAEQEAAIDASSRHSSDDGYGLYAVRRLVSARGGEFLLSNRSDGSGAEITFTLPGRILHAEDYAA